MKRILVAMAAVLFAAFTPAFAGKQPEPGQKTLESFKREFVNAEQVVWDKEQDYDKATFILAGCRAVAFFNEKGELAGSIRDIFYNQLPLSVMTALDKKFPEAIIYDVREISNEEGTSYRVTLEEKNKRKLVRITASGFVDDVEKL